MEKRADLAEDVEGERAEPPGFLKAEVPIELPRRDDDGKVGG